MAFRVETSAKAERQMEAIQDWLLAQHAGEQGLRWYRRLSKALASLAKMPHRCALVPDYDGLPLEVRQLLFGNKPHVYCILFTIDGDTVTVIDVRHGRRLREPAS